MITRTVAALDVPPFSDRAGIAAMERTAAAYDAAMAERPEIISIERGGTSSAAAPLAFPFTVAAWNLERCLFPPESAIHLAATGATVVLLSEMDNGMARTQQRHPTAELAGALGMSYAYGVEFIELDLGSETERAFCRDDFNEKGFHGNALMAAVPIEDPFMIRLWGERIWLINGGDQPRLGERFAIGAVVRTESGPFLAVSTHLESATSAAYRERQVRELIDVLDAHFSGLPVLIGGDLNTGLQDDGNFEAEGLFAMSAARGFDRHGSPLDVPTLRQSLISAAPARPLKLDWFLSRGVRIGDSRITPSLDATGRPLSDHDLITCVVDGFS
ncbi:endonuclease/exonuclease/phosphatase family protein [Sinorhizobium sp. RAC02]|uniref:endonuclease/exonuclease/phosphatase family protein n=1 Tax=Sinorhizobium sp. RAC02 TaxID=1842534 RepID=UPI00083CF2C7|nr:endonuclease/exonuclease/phosphatase family protein [Sinorhizobium sp. RAC02]AOF94326.1 endonuclease/Exonuclease/phosphatase family protein [Sinorhizobium sp. RAC02]